MLKMIGIRDFKIIPDNSEETIVPGDTPEQTVCKIALKKAMNVSRSCDSGDTIIAADTLVYIGDTPLAKPVDREDAANMLRALSGRKHTVYTGVALIHGETQIVTAERTDVYFRELSDAEILAYADSDEPMDKAGAYAAQGRGAVFIERVDGEFFNVMGLPLCRLTVMLREFDYRAKG
jgi:septum formation protein